MKRLFLISFTIILCTGLLFGCSSRKYVKSARTSFENAEAAGSEKRAAYEYYSAEAYLDFAEHELDEGDHAQAKVFAEESEKYSAEAIEKTGGGGK